MECGDLENRRNCRPDRGPVPYNYCLIKCVHRWAGKLPLTHIPTSQCPAYQLHFHQCIKQKYWVNLSERGGKDGVFQGLAGLLRGISRCRSPREFPKSSPASLRKTPSFPTLLLGFTFYFQHGFSQY